MLIQISAGHGKGIQECEYACCLLYKELLREFPTLEVVSTSFRDKECLKSAVFYTDDDVSFLEGTVQWTCQSPFRRHHKRKNWFVDISMIQEEMKLENTDEVRYEVFRSSGHGGQNVNKTSTAIRAIHIPTGILVVCMDQRSQLQNKKIAYLRLIDKLNEENLSLNQNIHYENWNEHNKIVRGDPIRHYQGLKFKRII